MTRSQGRRLFEAFDLGLQDRLFRSVGYCLLGVRPMRKMLLFALLAVLVLSLMPVAAQDQPFAGKKIVVVSQQGAIGDPARKYGEEWAAKSGATVEVQQFAYADLFPKVITALQTGSGEFDVIIVAADYLGDIAGGGYLLPIPDDVKTAVDWNDILPLYRER